MNNTTHEQRPPPPPELASLENTVDLAHLISGIYISIIAVLTINGNGLLLLAIIKDPFKSFRTPTTLFVVGLAVADVLTGAVVEPLTAYIYIGHYLKFHLNPDKRKAFIDCAHFTSQISFVTMNASFLILLALTFCQYVAISFPHKHRSIVNHRNVMTALIVIAIYSVLFSLLPEYNVPLRLKMEIDVLLNTNAIALVLLLSYGLLYRAYHLHLSRVSSLDENQAARALRREQEREFTVANLLLVSFFLVFTLPSMILWNLRLFKYYDIRSLPFDQQLRLSLTTALAFDVLVMKFALDPCIYAWRLSKYRHAIKKIIKCGQDVSEIDASIPTNTTSLASSRHAGVDGKKGQERGRSGSTAFPLNLPHQSMAEPEV